MAVSARRLLVALVAVAGLHRAAIASAADAAATPDHTPLTVHLRRAVEVAPAVKGWNRVTTTGSWDPAKTAIIVCDMWDTHTCPNAATRVAQMAPRMNDVLTAARDRGVFIIHCPSGTMDFYKDHPGRKLAQAAPPVEPQRPLERWCRLDPEREPPLPIDDSDGGCDCERTWKPGDPYPWTRQIATLEIEDGDAITDSAEAYALLRQRGIEHVIVMGVHTNMCVLGRPFSIRQLVYQDLNVALMRDLTDTMYNPAMRPFVSHFTGTDLVVEHIEKYWCPTITSADIIGGAEYRFPEDTRPTVVMLLGETEYKTGETLPKFALDHLGKHFRVVSLFLDEDSETNFPGIDAVRDADVVLVSARRRPLVPAELRVLRDAVAAGTPVVGIRTASHAFHLRNKPAPAGLADWPDLDATVFGGSYSNHYGHDQQSLVWPLPAAKDHPILAGLPEAEFPGGGGLYQTAPLKPGTTELLRGRVEGVAEPEPVAWTFTRPDGGASFYTSLGHPADFERPEFTTLLANAVTWAAKQAGAKADRPAARAAAAARPAAPTRPAKARSPMQPAGPATTLPVPGTWNTLRPADLADYDGFAWYLCAIQPPADWATRSLYLYVENVDNACETFFNGTKIGVSGSFPPAYESGLATNQHRYVVPPEIVNAAGPNVVAIRVYDHDGDAGFKGRAPALLNGKEAISTAGDWVFRRGDDPAWAQTPAAGLPTFTTVGPAPALGPYATVIRRAAQDEPLSPQQSLDLFTVPDDLEVEVVLAEPTIAQPLFMNFDDRGRLWVMEYLQYPEPAGLTLLSKDQWWRAVYDGVPEPPPHGVKGRDRISIHEDTDGDGTFDTHTIFVDGLNIATSFAQGRGGVFVTNPPYLLFYPDRDGDDVPDGDPEVLLSGFGLEDTHSVINSLRFGPDGWLYGAQGSTVSATVKRPGTNDAVFTQGQNIWRYHPETRRYEVFAEGGGNAFCVEIDAAGRVFSGHNGGNTRGFHYMQGASLQKGFSKHGSLSNPYAFGYFPAMEHGDYARFTHGILRYEGTGLPERYVGTLIGVNPITRHVVVSEMTPTGSTYKTRDLHFAIESADDWFRPVDIKDGPDGAVYVADWYDGQLAHTANYQGGMDRAHGRIYRIKARTRDAAADAAVDDAAATTPASLVPDPVAALSHPNRWHRQTAVRLIGDRHDAALVPALLERVRADEPVGTLDALWALALSGGLDAGTIPELLAHPNPQVRLWTVRLLADEGPLPSDVAARVAALARTEPDLEARCHYAASAQRLPPEQALPIIAALATHDADTADPRQPLLLWWAWEKVIAADPQAAVTLLDDAALWQEPLLREAILPRLMRRFAATGRREDLAVCATLLDRAPDAASTTALMQGFEEAFRGRSLTGVPPALVAALAKAGGGSLALKVRQGDPEAITEALSALADEKTPTGKRVEYAVLFGEVAYPPAVPVLLETLAATRDEAVQAAILGGLQAYADDRIAPAVLARYDQWNDDLRALAQSLLASRKASARALVEAVDTGRIPATALPAETVRTLTLHRDDRIAALVAKHWGDLEGGSTAAMQAQLERGLAVLADRGGDPYAGKPLYMQTCGKCHQLHGLGGQIGPDLTAYKRDDVRHMLMNVVNPSAEIREGFEGLTALLADGRVVQGFLVEQDPQVLVFRTTDGQTLPVERDAIDELVPQKKSLMPENLLADLSDDQIRSLFAYLRTTQPLP
jgi:putative membrane-bound dehydrogenase-like protein